MIADSPRSPKHEIGARKGQPASNSESNAETTLQPSREEEQDRTAAKSTKDSKPAEVPESDPTNGDANPKPLDSNEVPASDERAETEEEGDHVVEGDEDTVIY